MTYKIVKQQLEDKTRLGSINTNGTAGEWNIWDKYVMNGFGVTDVTLAKDAYLSLINDTYQLNVLVKIYQDAYDYMTA